MRLTLSPEQRSWLAKQFWFVHPNGDFIRRAIIIELENRKIDPNEADGTIMYKGKSRKSKPVRGFLIGKNFDMIEWLVTTKSDLEGFDAYHADFRDGPWEKFRKGEKTPKERMKLERIAKQMRENKKRLPMKSALMHKNRGL